MKTYNQRALEYLHPVHQELLSATAGCRVDMHEPDEQEMTAVVYGKDFDNAGVGNEIMVHLYKNGKQTIAINLATLIALARLADIEAARKQDEILAGRIPRMAVKLARAGR